MLKNTKKYGIAVMLTLGIIVFIWSFLSFNFHLKQGIYNCITNSSIRTANDKDSFKNDKKDYNILVLGDSLAKGTGDENNKGFAGKLADDLKNKTSQNVRLNNLAINGDVSEGLLQVVRSRVASNLIKKSNIIIISIGGNEIAKLKESNIFSIGVEYKMTKDLYIKNLRNIFKLIRGQNENCTIVCIGLYNPFGKNIDSSKVKLLNDWNKGTQDVTADDINAIFIPTYDLFKYNAQKYLTLDRFHPNGEGYKAIAKRIEEAVKQ